MESWKLTWTKLVAFNATNVDAIKSALPGVYRISYKADDDNYYVFYVGQAEDIKQRLHEHLLPSETNICIRNRVEKGNCAFRYAEITKDYIRNAAEQQMFKHYQPSCNEKEPSGRDDVTVNLT